MSPEGRPACFGDINKVFPLGADGLRTSPQECLACNDKTDCLRLALKSPDGAVVDRGGQVEKKGSAKLVTKATKGFRRWSALKTANRAKTDKS